MTLKEFYQARRTCPRVEQGIECPECGYAHFEAAHSLYELEYDPGHIAFVPPLQKEPNNESFGALVVG